MCSPTYLTQHFFPSLEAISTCFLVPHEQVPSRPSKAIQVLKKKSHFLTLLSVHFNPPACAFACLCNRLHLSLQRLTFHQNIHRFTDKTRSWTVSKKILTRRVSLFLFCTLFVCLFCRCTNITFVFSSAFILTRVIISPHGGHRRLFPPRLRQEKAFFSLHWWTGYILSLVQLTKKNRVYFLSASRPVSKNVFLLVWQTRCVSLCVNVYILLYMCGRTKRFLRAGAFFSACYFTCSTSSK